MGGLINDTLGWRWAFYLQASARIASIHTLWLTRQIPLLAVSGVLIYSKVNYTIPSTPGTSTPTDETPRQKLARIDFLGCFLLAGFVGALLLAVSLKTSAVGEDELAWSDPLIAGLFGASGGLFLIFMFVEIKIAKEPVLPLELLHRRTAVSVAIHNLVFSITLYAVVSPLLLLKVWVHTEDSSTRSQCFIRRST
jgi:MFS family permease